MKKSEQKKELILQAARDEFREVGYAKATINGITSRIGVNPSLLSYHFKNLHVLSQVICKNLLDKINETLKPIQFSESLSAFFTADLLEQFVTFNSETNLRFKAEIGYAGKVSKYTSFISHNEVDIKDAKYLEILNEYHLSLQNDMFQKLRTVESAGGRELWIQCYDQNLIKTYSKEEWWKLTRNISYSTVTLLFRFAGMPSDTIDRCFKEAESIVSHIDTSDLILL